MKKALSNKELPDSALKYILESLIPYTEANLKLSFRPNLFFNDLENIDRQRVWLKERRKDRERFERQTLRNQFYKAKKKGLITVEGGVPRLTEKGRRKIRPYKPQKLGPDAYLMVTFDIPENERTKRSHVRLLLKELSFTKVQQSVWISHYDHREYIKGEIEMLDLQDHVHVYECTRII